MRGKLFLTLSLCGLFLSSCDFSQDFGEVSSTESSDVTLTVNVSADDAIARVSGGLNRADNALKIRLSGAEYESDDDCLTLNPNEDGTSAVSFEGAVPEYGAKDNVYLYYSSEGNFSGTGFTKAISASQSGRAEDILDNVLYYSWARWDAIAAGRNGNAVEIAADMSPMAALIKFNIPEQLQARNIRIKASAPIAGTVTVNPQKGWGGIGDNALLQSEGLHDEIVIESEDPVGGDLYVVVMPDSFDKESNAYCNTAQTITFSCDYYEGELAKRYSLSDYIVCGAMTDLGQIPMPKPKIPVEPGSIRLLSDANLTIGINNPNPDCEYYYEIASSEQSCAKPTTASAKFDPSVGFCPEITANYNRYYIKVLAHALDNDYSDVVLTASLRNWRFDENASVVPILKDIADGKKMAVVGDKEITSDGLEVYRNQTNALSDLEVLSNRIAFTSARVQINAITEYASDAWIGFFVDKNISVKAGSSRGYRFYYNNSQSTADYWSESVTSAGGNSDRYHMCLHLTEIFKANGIKAGDKFGLRGDGKHVYYGIALLEVL
jgi:hypothetical protein